MLLCFIYVIHVRIIYAILFPFLLSQTLNRCSDSMGSLGHRAILQYVETNDLPGLKVFLGSRHLSVDDRDEVIL